MKYLVIVFMLVCSVAWGGEWQAPEYNEKVPNKGWVITEIISQIEANKKDDTDKKLDQIYSMICDLETKFMGNDRMEQITNPDHIPEAVRQKIWQEEQIRAIKRGISK